jgi:homoserine dehydrogenase
MRQITLALMGFGNVAQAFVELLVRKQDLIKSELNAEILVTGIFSKNHGAAINSGGVNLKRALETRKQGGSLLTLSERNQPINAESFIYDASAEIFVETIPLNQYNGQPA